MDGFARSNGPRNALWEGVLTSAGIILTATGGRLGSALWVAL